MNRSTPVSSSFADLSPYIRRELRRRSLAGMQSPARSLHEVFLGLYGEDYHPQERMHFLIFAAPLARRVVLDLAAPEGDEDSARALLDAAIGDGSREVLLGWFSRSPWFLLAQRLGFRVAPADLPYLAFRGARGAPEPHWLMDRWHVAQADVGLHALPSLLAPEEIVTSAPFGTLTGRERHA